MSGWAGDILKSIPLSASGAHGTPICVCVKMYMAETHTRGRRPDSQAPLISHCKHKPAG